MGAMPSMLGTKGLIMTPPAKSGTDAPPGASLAGLRR